MPLQGLTDLYGQTADGSTGAGALESQGTTVAPEHGQWGDSAGYPWTAGPYPSAGQDPYAQDWAMIGEAPPVAPSGTGLLDKTPVSAAAPYPRLTPAESELRNTQAQWDAQSANMGLHAVDLGAGRFNDARGGHETRTHWSVHDGVSAGSTLLQQVPAQIRGAGTGKDVAQGYGTANRFGFDSGHLQYRAQSDPVPGNYQWLQAAERPFIVPQAGVQATFDGPDSPYGVQGDTTQNMYQGTLGATVEGTPTAYQAPPDPATVPASALVAEAPSIGAGWW